MRPHLLPLCLIAVCIAVVLTPAAAQAETPTYDQAVNRLVRGGYPQAIETYLNGLGANPLGFRLAGTAPRPEAAPVTRR